MTTKPADTTRQDYGSRSRGCLNRNHEGQDMNVILRPWQVIPQEKHFQEWAVP